MAKIGSRKWGGYQQTIKVFKRYTPIYGRNKRERGYVNNYIYIPPINSTESIWGHLTLDGTMFSCVGTKILLHTDPRTEKTSLPVPHNLLGSTHLSMPARRQDDNIHPEMMQKFVDHVKSGQIPSGSCIIYLLFCIIVD